MSKTIVYIISDVRSGSTLVDYLLSCDKKSITVGELMLLGNYIRHNGYGADWNWNCSCGKQVLNCDFWSSVLEGFDNVQKIETRTTLIGGGIVGNLLLILTNKLHNLKRKYTNQVNSNVLDNLNKIYSTIFSKFPNKELIIDSSKRPEQAFALYLNKKEAMKFIYIHRDIRAVTLSKIKHEKDRDSTYNRLKFLIASFLQQLKIFVFIKRILPENVHLLTYEQLANLPVEEMEKISDFLNIERIEINNTMSMKGQHSIAGTPARFSERKIELDEKWKNSSKGFFNLIGGWLNKLILLKINTMNTNTNS